MWLFLFLVWIILNGRITLELVIFGALIASAVFYFAYRVIGYSVTADHMILRNLPVLILYLLNLVREIIISAFTLVAMVYRADDPDPKFVEFHSGLESEIQNVILANSITLTPGTITVFQEGDHFVIHCLKDEFGEGLEDSTFIRLLKKLQ